MPQQHQVKFRASDRFLDLIKSECLKREMSLQELMTASIKFYSQTPAEWDVGTLFTTEREKGLEQHNWLALWHQYIGKMPREKVLLIVEVMKLDLLHYRSSRRKADLKKRQGRAGNGGRPKGGR